jgi:NADPH-dependent 2,4-dienoyl-CoA reductase/sulfur reductase-like enzyme
LFRISGFVLRISALDGLGGQLNMGRNDPEIYKAEVAVVGGGAAGLAAAVAAA